MKQSQSHDSKLQLQLNTNDDIPLLLLTLLLFLRETLPQLYDHNSKQELGQSNQTHLSTPSRFPFLPATRRASCTHSMQQSTVHSIDSIEQMTMKENI